MNWKERIPYVHDTGNISGFFGEYRWLSNFEPCLVEYEGLIYKSSEAAYQAAKCADKNARKLFLDITASEAKKLGRKITMRADWENIKLAVMQEILESKFNKNSYLRDKLIATGNKYLEETNWWSDRFW